MNIANIPGSGIVGARFITGTVTTTTVGGASAFGGEWAWYGGTVWNTGSSVSRTLFNRLVSATSNTTGGNASSTQNLTIGGSGAFSTLYCNADIAFAAVFEIGVAEAQLRQWMNADWPMFHRDASFIYDDNTIQVEDDAVALDDLTISTAGPLELSDDGITGTAEAGGSVDTTPPASGPLELSDNAMAGTVPTTIENPTVIALAESAAAASALNIPNPLSLSDNAFAGSKATTILNSNPGILAEGRYRG